MYHFKRDIKNQSQSFDKEIKAEEKF